MASEVTKVISGANGKVALLADSKSYLLYGVPRSDRSNPIADTAEEFWKTFRNWPEAIDRGDLDPTRTHFHLHISTPFDGEVASTFSEATEAWGRER